MRLLKKNSILITEEQSMNKIQLLMEIKATYTTYYVHNLVREILRYKPNN